MTSVQDVEETKEKHAKESRWSFVALGLIAIFIPVVFFFLTSADVANFFGALFVGLGGWVMVLIRQAQQNADRAERLEQGSAPKPPGGSRITALIVGVAKLPSREARKAERKKIEEASDKKAAFKNAVSDAEDLGFGLVGLGGLMVAAGALRSLIGW